MDGVSIFMTVLGYLGAVGIAIFSVPEVINVLKNKKTSHLNKTSVSLFTLLLFSSLCLAVSGFYTFGINITNPNADAQSTYFGLAVAIANVCSFATPSIILIYKLVRYRKAKSLKITELELEQRNKKQK